MRMLPVICPGGAYSNLPIPACVFCVCVCAASLPGLHRVGVLHTLHCESPQLWVAMFQKIVKGVGLKW